MQHRLARYYGNKCLLSKRFYRLGRLLAPVGAVLVVRGDEFALDEHGREEVLVDGLCVDYLRAAGGVRGLRGRVAYGGVLLLDHLGQVLHDHFGLLVPPGVEEDEDVVAGDAWRGREMALIVGFECGVGGENSEVTGVRQSWEY